jgi:NADH-quinone oxidoreductase subunit E
VNYRFFHKVSHEAFDQLVDDLRAGRLDDEVPPHGTLARIRQRIPAERAAGPADPTVGVAPPWMGDSPALDGTKGAGS